MTSPNTLLLGIITLTLSGVAISVNSRSSDFTVPWRVAVSMTSPTR